MQLTKPNWPLKKHKNAHGQNKMTRTNVDSASVEAGHGNVESLALRTDEVIHGNLAVLKRDVQ